LKNKVKDLRERHGITQRELADSLYHVRRARISDWESGRRGIPPIIWWAMVLIWDHKDIRTRRNAYIENGKKSFDKQ
jgi:DNA-binding XRE family transcriptional regulator